MGLHIDDLPPETRERLLGQAGVKVGKEELVRAASDILSALNKTGLPVAYWKRALKLADKWLKER